MKTVHISMLVLSYLLASILLPTCHPSPRDLTVVTGKTVYGEQALENVTLQVHQREEAGWRYLSDSRSGYHGSFRLHLPPGTYRITASKTIRAGQEQLIMTGVLGVLEVKSSTRRIDQVVIKLTPGGGMINHPGFRTITRWA